jgi:aromatic ring-opening dioxygenase LigB subunit
MGKLLGGYVFPHPPIIVPEIGKGREDEAVKTVEGCKNLALDIKDKNPDTIIVLSPHGPTFSDLLSIEYRSSIIGNFNNFGDYEFSMKLENNFELADLILEEAYSEKFPLLKIDDKIKKEIGLPNSLDHGALVPLYFIKEQLPSFKIVDINMGFLPYDKLIRFGQYINKSIKLSNSNAVIVASGDLSHRLTKDAPAGFSKRGKEFDEMIVEIIESGNLEELTLFKEEFLDEAGQCGLRSFITMFGAINQYDYTSEVISYEGPFGVGYCTSKFEVD